MCLSLKLLKIMGQLCKIIYFLFLQSIFCNKVVRQNVLLHNTLENHRNNSRQIDVNNNICRYREYPYPEKIFSIQASWGCYRYTRDDMFVGGIIEPQGCPVQSDVENETTYIVPGILINEVCIPFSHTSPEIINRVTNSFQNQNIVQRWIDCTEDALICCRTVLYQYKNEENMCPPTWDAWTCFDRAPVGSSVKKHCSPYSYIAQPPKCNHYSYKECFLNGTWNSQTDYSTCSITPRLISRTNWHTAMLSISIIIASPAVLCLIFYEGHQFQKLKFIRNLLIAIVTRNILVLISRQVIFMEEMTNSEETIMSRNEWTCKLLAVFEKVATNLVFACMLLEGIFLHQLLTNVFASRGQMISSMLVYYIVVFGLSIISAISWAVVMAVAADEFCWLVTENNYFHWICDVPKLIMLITCTVLLCHIIFNIWRAFKHQDHIEHHAVRTAKASLLCMPLFGISFLLFIGRPDTQSCVALEVFYYFSYAFEGLQGVFVAILHCYTDREILNYYRRKLDGFAARFNWSKRHDSRVIEVGFRRDTTCTVVDGNDIIPDSREIRNSI